MKTTKLKKEALWLGVRNIMTPSPLSLPDFIAILPPDKRYECDSLTKRLSLSPSPPLPPYSSRSPTPSWKFNDIISSYSHKVPFMTG